MSLSTLLHITDKIIANEKSITKKRQEIEKRREVVETTSSTTLSQKRQEQKVSKIDDKIKKEVETVDKTIDYYKSEIDKAQKKMEADLQVTEQKATLEMEKIRNKFENYRLYCQDFIQQHNTKRSTIITPLEKQKEVVLEMMEKSEEDDKVLVRLKVELKQLLDDQKELEDESKKLQESVALQQKREREEFRQQEEEKFRAIQREELERARVEKEQRDELERQRKEEKWSAQKEQRVQELKEEKVKEETRHQDKTIIRRFQLEIYPKLSDKAVMIYNFLKDATDPHRTYKDAQKIETLEECEQFLLQYEDTFTKITSYCNKLSEDGQLEFESLALSDQLRKIQKNSVPSSPYGNIVSNSKQKKK
jgi:hypothetical protein